MHPAASRGEIFGKPVRGRSWLSALRQMQEEREIAFEILGDQKIFLHMLVPLFTEARGDFGVRKQKTDLIGSALHGVGEQAGVFVNDLRGNAANGGGHDWFLFP